ncbi:MAG: UDP-glucose 4-epimerase GalE [Flavobacteriales bacterium]
MKKVLVTGGAGYIGSHTVVQLHLQGYQPVVMDNLSNSERFIIDRLEEICGRSIPFYQLDCCEADSYKIIAEQEGEFEAVIHFAAFKAVGESVNFPAKYYRNNIGSLASLIEHLAVLNTKKMVFSSSCTVYGQPERLPVTETSPIQEAESPYGATKQIGEQLINQSVESQNYQSVILRYFNPIGAHHSGRIGELPKGVPNNLIPFITQTGIGKREQLSIFGNDYSTPDGTCIRDYIHVVDLANAHIKAIEYMENHPETALDYFNVGTGKGNSVLEMVEAFNKATKLELNTLFAPRRTGDIEQIWAETSKANQVLGWTAQKDIHTALADAWRWELALRD